MVGFVTVAAVAAAACAVPNRPAALIRAAEPDTPALAQQQRIFGTVQVAVTVGADGSVTAVRVVSSPSAILNAAALRAARDSTYRPQLQNCTPVTSDYFFSVTFDDPMTKITMRVSARGETLAVVETWATVVRPPDQVTVDGFFESYGSSEAAAFAADAAKFAQIVRETQGMATVRTVAGPMKPQAVKQLWTPAPGQPTPAPQAVVARELGLRVDRLDDVQHVAHVLDANGAETVEAYWSLRDPAAAESDALAAAMQGARTQADAFARSRQLRVVAVQRVEPERSRPVPYAVSHPTFVSDLKPNVYVERRVTVTYLLGH